ncbi:UDP-N-acetylmuramoyl-L-alanyl-D-glutamate--2,6-diaminopimelate ligase [Austwickia sp. TVS 96-490-7B]|nr:UDP-N-acetylmuramoyl-L-alanyl-D-glutamate--2,6-diaminopimelate ligase [Austwickia sp. TVS 96-490-7B]
MLVHGVCLDSRQVRPGDLYAALPGQHAHGASFASAAAHAGAVAVLTDQAGADLLDHAGVELARIVVADPRAVLGTVSAKIYGEPAEAISLIGITGTNGKTTTAYIVDAAAHALSRRTGLIGTIETRIGDHSVTSVRTTPESCDLHALFAAMREDRCDLCTMEVSSHALAMHRVDGARFDVAVFTNLSQDHLDFHPTMEDYFAAKASLFTPERAARGVICVDDEWGARLAHETTIPAWTVATRPDAAGPAQWRVVPTGGEQDPDLFDLVGPEDTMHLRSALPGDHNRANTAFAALALRHIGVSTAEIEDALAQGARVPGRLERIDLPAQAPTVYVDFAHTPDGIEATLATLRQVTDGKLFVVVGAGGRRDRGKRPLMGAAAARGGDIVVVTDDNPRDEDPATIRADVAAGARQAGSAAKGTTGDVYEVAGRREALTFVLQTATSADTIAVLGRGHETQQEVMGEFLPLDDRVAVREAAAALWPTEVTAR